jgi:hypothetical protein
VSETNRKRRSAAELGESEVPDVDVSTSVRARELRFKTVPETRVWFEGEPAQRSRSEVERQNLPEEVEPDVTYRDVRVSWRARARIVHPADNEGPDAAA